MGAVSSNLDSQASERAVARNDFLLREGYAEWAVTPLVADASFRQYFRLDKGEKSCLLMDAPPATEDIEAYVKIDRMLIDAGLRAPVILALDLNQGFAVIEDFGLDTYTKALDQGSPAEPLYELATQALLRLHTKVDAYRTGLPRYDDGFYTQEADLFIDWYWPARTGQKISDDLREEYHQIWQQLFDELGDIPECVVLRDYHVDNLMVIPNSVGLASCGLLDFQDALVGSVAYDMVSLFEDARRDVDQQMAAELIHQYLKARPYIDRKAFLDWYAVLGAHRHVKVAGIFVRLCVRDNKPHYLDYLQHVINMLQRSLSKPQLEPLAQWLEKHHPGAVNEPLTFDVNQVKNIINS